MNILIAPDKFKGSLTSSEVCDAIERGLRDSYKSSIVTAVPMADGGEGTCDLLTEVARGRKIKVKVLDPLFREIESEYGLSGDGKTAFIEMAKASGLGLLAPAERNPMLTSSIGTGQLIADAVGRRVDSIVLGIGGSATNDAGTGMAEALGFSFFSNTGEKLRPIGKDLHRIHLIQKNDSGRRLGGVSLTVLCDVTNPLYGPEGAAHVFAPQKGASKEEIVALDRGLRHLADVVERQLEKQFNFPGAGAAGGAGAGANAFLNAHIVRGFDYLSAYLGLPEKVAGADVVITGEGKIDQQSRSGKVVSGIAALARKHGKKCFAFAGKTELSLDEIKEMGLEQVYSLVDDQTAEGDAVRNAARLLTERARQAVLH